MKPVEIHARHGFDFGVVPPPWTLIRARPSDGTWIAELRAEVMRTDLERLGRYDQLRVRQRFLHAFRPEHTYVIEVAGSPAGSIAVRPEADCQWIEHFYLSADMQGNGIGSAVLTHIVRVHRDERPFRLNVLHGSRAIALYQRAGFTFDSQDGVDVYLTLT